MGAARLALFDCDGTLADSQYDIVRAMEAAFCEHGLAAPSPADIRAIIGLSVGQGVARLAPGLSEERASALANSYRDAFFAIRTAHGSQPEPLFEGVAQAVEDLSAQGWALGIATGKSRRGLLRLLDAHGLTDRFQTLQTADGHPSKPDPSMARAAIVESGASPATTVVIGDTAFDMAMARAAGTHALGVAWGYHDQSELRRAGANGIATSPSEIVNMVNNLVESVDG